MSRNKERIEKALRKIPGYEQAGAVWEPVTGPPMEKGGYFGGWSVVDERGQTFDWLGYSTDEALAMIEVKAGLNRVEVG